MKQALISLSNSRLFAAGLSWLESRQTSRPELLRVLTYHRVDHPDTRPDLHPGLISTSPEDFVRQVALLRSRCNVVELADVVDAFDGLQPLPDRAVLITFDDAYRDFAEQAWPILRQAGLPVTLFVPTAYPDQPQNCFWWDRLYRAICLSRDVRRLDFGTRIVELAGSAQRRQLFRALKEEIKHRPHDEAMDLIESVCSQAEEDRVRDNGVLGWDELRRLHSEGVTLAPHTRTHPLLNRLPRERMRDEVFGSWEDLVQQVPRPVPRVLAYPAGGVDASVATMIGELGFDLAFTTQRGINHVSRSDRFLLRRINIGRNTTESLLRVQLLSRLSCLSG